MVEAALRDERSGGVESSFESRWVTPVEVVLDGVEIEVRNRDEDVTEGSSGAPVEFRRGENLPLDDPGRRAGEECRDVGCPSEVREGPPRVGPRTPETTDGDVDTDRSVESRPSLEPFERADVHRLRRWGVGLSNALEADRFEGLDRQAASLRGEEKSRVGSRAEFEPTDPEAPVSQEGDVGVGQCADGIRERPRSVVTGHDWHPSARAAWSVDTFLRPVRVGMSYLFFFATETLDCF